MGALKEWALGKTLELMGRDGVDCDDEKLYSIYWNHVCSHQENPDAEPVLHTPKDMNLKEVLRLYYYHEKNVQISSEWDAGWVVKIGDSHNGFTSQRNFDDLDLAAEWLKIKLDEKLSKKN